MTRQISFLLVCFQLFDQPQAQQTTTHLPATARRLRPAGLSFAPDFFRQQASRLPQTTSSRPLVCPAGLSSRRPRPADFFRQHRSFPPDRIVVLKSSLVVRNCCSDPAKARRQNDEHPGANTVLRRVHSRLQLIEVQHKAVGPTTSPDSHWEATSASTSRGVLLLQTATCVPA